MYNFIVSYLLDLPQSPQLFYAQEVIYRVGGLKILDSYYEGEEMNSLWQRIKKRLKVFLIGMVLFLFGLFMAWFAMSNTPNNFVYIMMLGFAVGGVGLLLMGSAMGWLNI